MTTPAPHARNKAPVGSRVNMSDTTQTVLDDPEVQAALKVLRDSGHSPTKVRNAMKTLEINDLPDEQRWFEISGVSRPLAYGECGISWHFAYDHVWCVRSSTQCDYCGPFSKWTLPAHAHAACEPCRGTGYIEARSCTKCKGRGHF